VTAALCAPLQTEDFVVQSMPDASPAKWHLAHTSWFFEQFLLKPMLPLYRAFHPRFEFLFNSYYQTVGPMHQRPQRGLLTRPTVDEVCRYRAHVDEHMQELMHSKPNDEKLATLTELGLNHEQQHQELVLTDLKHLLWCNPLQPTYRDEILPTSHASSTPMRFHAFEGGIYEIGASGKHFCFDNETPRHRTLVEPYALADRLVTNGEYLEFIRDGGYRRPEFWLSDGWATVQSEHWTRPLYWAEGSDSEFTLAGPQPLDERRPVVHLSYYESDAFARWAGARLPTEAEWEIAAAKVPVEGTLLDESVPHPRAAGNGAGLKQLFGDVWEWTSSSYSAYPGYRPLSGALGEYNGKFMCNQLVLRGGSCATPRDHVRASYRNFFYPQARWQFMGVRLARAS
jgi:ergothioneine biosynthesis protein EgtB